MPRARPRPTLTLALSPQRQSALAAHVRQAESRAKAARERREGAPPPAPVPAAKSGQKPPARRRRKPLVETLPLRLARLSAQRGEALGAGAYDLVATLDAQLAETRQRYRLALARANARADKLERRGRGKSRDRFAELVSGSSVLLPVHLEIADALRDAVQLVGMAGGTPGARSGQAGDGKGNMRTVEGLTGLIELGEEFWGTLGTPAAGSPGGYSGRKTIRRVCKASDGGAAQAADSVRRARRLVADFADGCRDSAGIHPWAVEVAVRVILLNQTLSRAVTACGAIRLSEGRIIAQNVMVTGLEAVAPKLGILVD
ncbi:MAG: hypothetical protein IPK75_01400 [Acidobacteria bacterium]|nr:hypothetical protein [Acidobacteriota bacterium]